MPDEKAPSLGAFLPSSLMHHLSGEPMHDLSGVDKRHCRYQPPWAFLPILMLSLTAYGVIVAQFGGLILK
jgi:hypothetical protein